MYRKSQHNSETSNIASGAFGFFSKELRDGDD